MIRFKIIREGRTEGRRERQGERETEREGRREVSSGRWTAPLVSILACGISIIIVATDRITTKARGFSLPVKTLIVFPDRRTMHCIEH